MTAVRTSIKQDERDASLQWAQATTAAARVATNGGSERAETVGLAAMVGEP